MNLDVDYKLFADVWDILSSLDRYFYKFNKLHAPEAKSRVLLHVMTHYDPSSSKDLRPYVKKLAREIMKDGYKDIPVDFLDQTVTEEEELVEQSYIKHQNKTPDFADDVLSDIVHSSSQYKNVVGIALVSMKWFVLLCKCLEKGGVTATYFPGEFKKACLAIASNYQAFNSDCSVIYTEHGVEMSRFLSYEEHRPVNWCESNYSVENNRMYRKGSLRTLNDEELINLDLQEFKFIGTLNPNARIYRVWFDRILNTLLDMVYDDKSNILKCIIDDFYVIRTIGGSWSVLNPSLETEGELMKCELLTNLLMESNGKLLSCGSESAVIVTPEELAIRQGRNYCGVNLDFTYKDITDELV